MTTATAFPPDFNPDSAAPFPAPDTTPTPPRICILGGGFGGLYTALRLGQLAWDGETPPEIVLIDQGDRFVFLPLLYELVTEELETWEIAPPFTELLQHTPVRFVQGTVSAIDVAEQRVMLADGQGFHWDRLVLALGSETPLGGVPGVADHALAFRTVQDVYQLKERLRLLEQSHRDKIRVAIVGAGYSGIELACKLADRLGDRGRIRLIERDYQILSHSPEFNRESVRQSLQERGIWLDLETTVQSISADSIALDYRNEVESIPVDLVLWTVGNQVVPVVQSLPLPRTPQGRLSIEPTLQVVGHPHIFALGDLAEGRDGSGQKIPPTAQAAFQQADYAGWNLWASLEDRPLLPFRYQHLGEMMALGIDSATVSGLGLSLNGPLAHVMRRLAYLYRMPTLEHQLRVGFHWITRPFQDFLNPSKLD
ncbi:NAD(P)/FAD-dependent oxidoreductase [Prochlorothrix hollandica]|uniref:NAD(P)/FAD-dependent oxidoreductase n=1 Tax=Prochlorothrix hollandica TaxID=1223 RepID=UPI0003457F64|nr:FAD-dependent oxidoreductase [Prochlorothrix hollandica]